MVQGKIVVLVCIGYWVILIGGGSSLLAVNDLEILSLHMKYGCEATSCNI